MSGLLLAVLLFAVSLALPSPVITSACEVDYPPFCFEDQNGLATGFSVELLEAALSAMGREVSFTTGTCAEVRGLLESGTIEVLPLVGRTPEREALYDFSFPYMTLHGAVVVRADCDSITSVEDLDGLRVGVMAGDNAEEFMLRGNYGVELVSVSTCEEALTLLSGGAVDAVVIQRLVGLRLIEEMGLVDLKVLDWPLMEFRQDFCFAVRKGNSDLLALLNEGLSVVMADGTYPHLHATWFAWMEIPSRRLIVGGDADFPPFEFLDEEGNATGLNVDLMRAVAAEVGLDVEIRLDEWSSVRAGFEDGSIDALSGMFYSPDRGLEIAFTQPHTVVHYVAVVREGTAPETLADLDDLSVVVQRGDIMEEYLTEEGVGPLGLTSSQEEALLAVASGEYDCAVVARGCARWFMDSEDLELVLGSTSLMSPDYCFAVREGNAALLAELSEGLQIVEETGGYRRIFEEWMGSYPEAAPLTIFEIARRTLFVLLPLGFLLLWVLLWLRLLRRQVRLRTTELRRNELLLDTTQAITRMGGWEYDVPRGKMYWTRETFRIHGMEPGSSPDADPYIAASAVCYPPGDRVRVMAAFDRCVETGEPYEMECRFLAPAGEGLWVRTAGRAVMENGSVRKVSGYIQDITTRKASEARIAHLNLVLLTIRDVNQLIVRETDPDSLIGKAVDLLLQHRSYRSALLVLVDDAGRPGSWAGSGQAREIPGLSERLAAGELPVCSIPGDDSVTDTEIDRRRECAPCPLRDSCGGALPHRVPLDHNGVRFGWLFVAMQEGTSADAEEQSLLGELAGDLAYALAGIRGQAARRKAEAEREAMQSQLLQSQKLEAIGQLAGGVAHDFNNMLQVILGHAQILSESPQTPDCSSSVSEILEAARRASDLTRQLLLFSRRQVMSLQTLDFNGLVENMLKMIRRLIGENIRLEWLPGSDVGSIRGDAGMIEQVLMNLCVNSRDAMPEGGVLTIETLNVLIDSEYCAIHAWAKPGRYVLLSVMDTGAGMDAETLKRMFEPFFTTKEEGKGTGIGLATAYGIVKQHEGMINAYSEPGKGTLFKVYLPMTEQKAVRVGARLLGAVSSGTETILLAEDDGMVRDLACRILEMAGYTVLLAENGREAVEVFRAHPDVDLLLLDVMMPHLGGREALNRIRSLRPDVPALFSSGYSENAIHTNFVLHEGLSLIQKPYSSEELLRAVREALAARTPQIGAAD